MLSQSGQPADEQGAAASLQSCDHAQRSLRRSGARKHSVIAPGDMVWLGARQLAAAALCALTAAGLGARRCEAVHLDLAAEHAFGGGDFSPAGRMKGSLDLEVGMSRLRQQGVATGHNHVPARPTARRAPTCRVVHARTWHLCRLADSPSPSICLKHAAIATPLTLRLSGCIEHAPRAYPCALVSTIGRQNHGRRVVTAQKRPTGGFPQEHGLACCWCQRQ